MSKKSINIHDIILYGIIAGYIVILAVLLFFKSNSSQSINLIPLRFIRDYFINGGVLAFSNTIGNIVLFVPMGVYIALLNNKESLHNNTAWILLFSMAVEFLQLILKVGVADIDDVILNVAGGVLGLLSFKVLRNRFKDKTRTAVEIISLILGGIFVILFLCLHYGVFGIRIRIL